MSKKNTIRRVDIYLNGEYSCTDNSSINLAESKEKFLKKYENVRSYEVKCEYSTSKA